MTVALPRPARVLVYEGPSTMKMGTRCFDRLRNLGLIRLDRDEYVKVWRVER